MRTKIFACCFSLAAFCGAAEPNLFPNGDFERFDGNLPEGWSVRSWNNEYVKSSWGQAKGRSGGTAFRMERSSPMAANTFTLRDIAVEPETVYTFKGYYRSTARKFDMEFHWLDADGKKVDMHKLRAPASQDEWILFFDELRTPPKTVALRVLLIKKHTGEPVEVDDFSLRKGGIRQFAAEFMPQIHAPGPNIFPIFGWVPPTDAYAKRRKNYQPDRIHAEYACANFTAWGNPEFGVMRRLSPKNELTPEMDRDPMIFCLHGGDEPMDARFPELVQLRDEARKTIPSVPFFNNLLPVYGFSGFEEYERHLENYFSMLKPKIVTYDHYAFFRDGTFLEDYFPNLALFRRAAMRHGSDFGLIAQLTGFGPCRAASEGELRFQAFTSLAFGAKIHGWFTFLEPIGQFDDWHDAVIDTEGYRTAHYAMVRRLNGEILQLGRTLLECRNTGVFFNSDTPRFCESLTNARLVKRVSGGAAVVGEFRHRDGRDFVMIVNRNYSAPAELEIEFAGGKILAVRLDAGDGKFLEAPK